MPQPKGCAPPRGRRAIPQGLFPRPPQGTEGRSVDGGDRHGRQVPCAPEPGEWHGVTPVGLDALARLCGQQGGGDTPADVALFPQGALPPVTAGTGCVDQDPLRALRRELPEQLVDSTRSGPDRAEGDDLRARVLGSRSDGAGCLRPIHADVERARLFHG